MATKVTVMVESNETDTRVMKHDQEDIFFSFLGFIFIPMARCGSQCRSSSIADVDIRQGDNFSHLYDSGGWGAMQDLPDHCGPFQ